jgi:tRNA modification GTPase
MGRGAIATIAIDGSQAAATVDRFFRSATGKKVELASQGPILFGRWQGDRNGSADDDHGEELVVCRTGDQRVEIHCHGGAAAARRILACLEQAGCTVIDWPAWVSQDADPVTADAIVALSRVVTERCAAILLDQLRGALTAEIKTTIVRLMGDPVDALSRLRDLLKFADVGMHLCDPWRVVFAGPPNVGKSSLINAIVGYQRSIVFDQPGTTRDVVTVRTVWDGWPLELADTAGLRDVDDRLEAAGVDRARQRIWEADLVVVVRDAQNPVSTPVPPNLANRWLHVANKSDLAVDRRANGPSALPTSAVTGEGIDRLLVAITKSLVPDPPPENAPVPFMPKHRTIISQAMEFARAGDTLRAQQVLWEMVRSTTCDR